MANNYIDRFEVIAELGRGGMATVFHAYDPDFDRPVAIKVMPREFLHVPDFKTRFQREARTIAALEHDAIVPVYDIGVHDDLPYLVMRYMPGGSLTGRIEREPLSVYEVTALFQRLAPAIDFAHAQGFVHRDLKPDNILFDQHDNAFIADFGIAKLMHSTSQLTGSGSLVGTPAYMSPEQIQDDGEVDHRSDLYSLGVILYETLTAQMPFLVSSPLNYLSAHLNDPVPDIRDVRSDLPPAFSSIIYRAMAKDKDERYLSAADLSADLARAPETDADDIDFYADEYDALLADPPPARRIPYALIGGGAFILLLLVGVFLSGVLRGSPEPDPVVVQITATPELASSEGSENVTDPVEDGPTPTAESVEDEIDLDELRQAGLIAFDSDRDDSGNREIYVMRADGENITRLTVEPGSDTDPAWSSDGERIVFVSSRDGNQEIYVMNADGSNPQRLTDEPAADFSPDFSPDGTQIVFVSERDGNREIYTMNADGSNPTRLTRTEEARDEYPAWSPDGSLIAFSSSRTGTDRVYIMNADGSDAEPLTDAVPPVSDWAPAWSPDGSQIAFLSTRAEEGDRPAGSGTSGTNVHTINTDGTDLIRLTYVRSAALLYTVNWSPDGTYLAYDNSVTASRPLNVFIISIDNLAEENITGFSSANHRNPDWWAPSVTADAEEESDSAESSEDALLADLADYGPILYNTWPVTDEQPRSDIYVIDADGRDRMRLTIESATDLAANWSPDGTQIVFASERQSDASEESAPRQLYIMDSDGSNASRLSEFAENVVPLSWTSNVYGIMMVSLNRDIFWVDPETGTITPLTPNTDDSVDVHPELSPDETQIAFSSDRFDNVELMLMDVDGSNPRRLTTTLQENEYWAHWSPDGRYIAHAITSGPQQLQQIALFEVETGTTLPLTGLMSVITCGLDWSPDGRFLAYASQSGLHILEVQTGTSVRILNGFVCDPDWYPLMP